MNAFVPLQSQSFQAKCSLAALMQIKWTPLPSEETQNDIQADAGKDESVESIRHFTTTHVEGTDYMRVLISYSSWKQKSFQIRLTQVSMLN